MENLYQVPIIWKMQGSVNIVAKSAEEAQHLAKELIKTPEDTPPDKYYFIEGSLEIGVPEYLGKNSTGKYSIIYNKNK